MTNKLEIEAEVLKALFAPNASFRQRKDACEKARAAYEAWEFAAQVEEYCDHEFNLGACIHCGATHPSQRVKR